MFFYFLSFSSDYLIKQIFTANKLIDKIELAPSGQYSKDHFLCQIPVFFSTDYESVALDLWMKWRLICQKSVYEYIGWLAYEERFRARAAFK